jgi:hypothetical protein
MATQKTASKQAEPANDGALEGLPIFFKKPHILDAVRHAKSGVSSSTGFAFAQETNSIPLTLVEFSEAAKSYPIVFAPGAQLLPAVVVGLEKNNYFVDEKGEWLRHNYIPAHARQYPFIFFEQPEEDRFFLCIDEASPQFQMQRDASAEPLYTDDGVASELGKRALEFCTQCYQQHLLTREFCEDLQKYHLIKSFQSDATLNSGKKIQLGGFMMVDEEAVNALTDEAVIALRKKGWLPAIYFALASTRNWQRLVDLAPQS